MFFSKNKNDAKQFVLDHVDVGLAKAMKRVRIKVFVILILVLILAIREAIMVGKYLTLSSNGQYFILTAVKIIST